MADDRSSPGAGPLAVLGGGGLVGRAVVAAALADGRAPRCVVRGDRAAVSLRDQGADVVRGDLREQGAAWVEVVAGAEVIVCGAFGPLRPPVRPRQVRAHLRAAPIGLERVLAAASADARIVVLSSALADHALGRALRAIERLVVDDARVRVLRTPWVYGARGPMHWVAHSLRVGRFRVVGPGDNRWSLLAAADAARAALRCADLPPGRYGAAEPSPPTQRELVEHLCARHALRIPDHVPPWLARATLGRPLAQAFAASLSVATSPELLRAGWTPDASWEEDFLVEDPAEE